MRDDVFKERLLMQLEALNVNLEQIAQVLLGQVPRFHLTEPDADTEAHVQRYFEETPPGSVRKLDQATSDALSQVKKL